MKVSYFSWPFFKSRPAGRISMVIAPATGIDTKGREREALVYIRAYTLSPPLNRAELVTDGLSMSLVLASSQSLYFLEICDTQYI